MAAFGVHSEVGKLRKVIVHRPDLSLQRLTPANHDDLLFDDVLWVEQAQREHDAFVEVMRERGAEVFYVHDLLAETLATSDEARRKLIEAVASPYTVGWSIVRRSARVPLDTRPEDTGQTPDRRHDRRRSRSRLERGAQGLADRARRFEDLETFVLPPLPNTLFMRDSSCWIYNGVSVNPMFWPARRREALNMLAIYRYHPMFHDAEFDWWYPAMGDDGQFDVTDFGRAIARRRRRAADRQWGGPHRNERAHPGTHDRADRESALREWRR